MKRSKIIDLVNWKNKTSRNPLILMGARQVGKTFLLKEFGEKEFPTYHYFNFEKSRELNHFFEENIDPKKILEQLAIYSKSKISKSDLIIFDEIQACPMALTSLKYFSEEFSDGYICAAGSLLGLYLSETSFPVGKVEITNLYPFSFMEFIDAIQMSDVYHSYIQSPNAVFHQQLWQAFKNYLIVGGLPGVIKEFLGSDDHEKFDKVREKQELLILGYLADMAKHCGKENSMLLEKIWRTSAEHVGQEKVEKFIFKGLFPGKKTFQDFMTPIQWLKKAGLLYQISLIDNITSSLSLQRKENIFKLFVFDIGIMNCLAQIPYEHLLTFDFSHKGFLAEAFVLQELVIKNKQVYSYKHSTTEVEFLIQMQGNLIPIEVKAGQRLKSKSLTFFMEKFKINKAFRFSMRIWDKKNNHHINDMPLFMINKLF